MDSGAVDKVWTITLEKSGHMHGYMFLCLSKEGLFYAAVLAYRSTLVVTFEDEIAYLLCCYCPLLPRSVIMTHIEQNGATLK